MKAQAIGTKAPDALRAYARAVTKGLRALIEEAGLKIVRLAQSRVPSDVSDLRATIRAELTQTAGKVVSHVTAGQGLPDPDVAAFVEFGTGMFVDVPKGLEQYARTFYRNGKGTLQPSPYFYPSVFETIVQLQKDIRTLIKTGKVPS